MPKQNSLNHRVKTRWLSSRYVIAPSTTALVTENQTITCTVSTIGVTNGTLLYWTILNITTASTDFSNSSGSVTINSNTGSITITSILDGTSESTEYFRVQLRTGSTIGPVVAQTPDISIPNATLSFDPAYPIESSYNEGSTVTIGVITTNVAVGTQLYWFYNPTTLAADFAPSTGGNFTLTDGGNGQQYGVFSFNILNDLSTEGPENFQVEIRRASSAASTLLLTTNNITINDTSVDGPNNRVMGVGNNFYYALGDGTNINRPDLTYSVIGQQPVSPPFLKIATSGDHTMVIKNDGTLWAVGRNNFGQLGDNSTIDKTNFVRVGNATSVAWTWSDVVCGSNFTVGLRATPSVALYSWGSNSDGQLGTNSTVSNTTYRTTPTTVVLTGNSNATITGPWDRLYAGSSNWVVRFTGPSPGITIWAWAGSYYNSENGWGSGITNRVSTLTAFIPTWNNPQNNIVTAIDVDQFQIGSNFGMVRMTDGRVTCSGRNFAGQFGNSSTTQWFEFRSLTSGGHIWNHISVSPRGQSVLAIKNDGTLWAWGSNASGQLGQGNTTSRSSPVPVGYTVTSIQSGGTFSYAKNASGDMLVFGSNSEGQLGLGAGQVGINQLTPQSIWNPSMYPNSIFYTDGQMRMNRSSPNLVMLINSM